jgi:iron complex transport system substrate-binding protein
MISTEVLGDHDADRVVVLKGAFYDEQAFLRAPTFQALPAVVERSVIADGDLWFGTFPFAIYWTLLDLTALHTGAGEDGIGAEDDVEARLAAFQELTT